MTGDGDRSVVQVDQLAAMAAEYPDEIGYRVLGRGQLTFAQWDGQANRLARGLTSLGVAHGARVAIQLEVGNALRWVIAYAGIHKAGAVAVPFDPRLAPSEVAHMVDHARVVAMIVDGERVANAMAGPDESTPPSPSLRLVIDASPDGRPPTGSRRVENGPGYLPWDEALDADASPFRARLDADDLADIMFTSGTTGRPKGVAVRHVNASTVPNSAPVWSGSLWLHASPLTTFAGLAFVYAPMKLGMTCVYQPRFDADEWLDFVESDAPEAVFLVPAMVQLLLGHPRFDRTDFSSVKLCSVGSAPLAPSAIDRLQDANARCRRVQQLRDDRGRVGLLPDAERRGRAASRVGGQAPSPGQGPLSSTGTATKSLPASTARSSCGSPVASVSTSRTPRPPPKPGSTVGCAPVTSAGSMTTATSTSGDGPRTSSSGAGRTSTPWTSST